jgi:hypothetical protein
MEIASEAVRRVHGSQRWILSSPRKTAYGRGIVPPTRKPGAEARIIEFVQAIRITWPAGLHSVFPLPTGSTAAVRPTCSSTHTRPRLQSSAQPILLIWNLLIRGNNNLKLGRFHGGQQGTVLQARQFCVRGCLAVVSRKQQTESLVNALIQQDLTTPEQSGVLLTLQGPGRRVHG